MQALDIAYEQDGANLGYSRIETTLYELIDVINEEILPGEEELVPEVVQHMVVSGKINFIGNPQSLDL
jgi:hypothetical protein